VRVSFSVRQMCRLQVSGSPGAGGESIECNGAPPSLVPSSGKETVDRIVPQGAPKGKLLTRARIHFHGVGPWRKRKYRGQKTGRCEGSGHGECHRRAGTVGERCSPWPEPRGITVWGRPGSSRTLGSNEKGSPVPRNGWNPGFWRERGANTCQGTSSVFFCAQGRIQSGAAQDLDGNGVKRRDQPAAVGHRPAFFQPAQHGNQRGTHPSVPDQPDLVAKDSTGSRRGRYQRAGMLTGSPERLSTTEA